MAIPGYFGSQGGQKIDTLVFQFTPCGDSCVKNAAEIADCSTGATRLGCLCQDPNAQTEALRCINGQCCQEDLHELEEAMEQCPISVGTSQAATSSIHISSAITTVVSTTHLQSHITTPTEDSTNQPGPSRTSKSESMSSQPPPDSVAPTFSPSTTTLTSVLSTLAQSTNVPSSYSPAAGSALLTTSGAFSTSSHNPASGKSTTISSSAPKTEVTSDPRGPPRAVVSALSTVLAVIALVVIVALAVYVRRRRVLRRSYGRHVEQVEASQVVQFYPHAPSLPHRSSDFCESGVGSPQGQDEATSAHSIRYSEYSDTPLLVVATQANTHGSTYAGSGVPRWAIDIDRTTLDSASLYGRRRAAWHTSGAVVDAGTVRSSVLAVTGVSAETARDECAAGVDAPQAGRAGTRRYLAGAEQAFKASGSDVLSPTFSEAENGQGPVAHPSVLPRSSATYNAGPPGLLSGWNEARFLTVLMDLHQENAGDDDPPPYHPPVASRSLVPSQALIQGECVGSVDRAQ
ncbi:hypothetical protein BD413DRAFT_250843 [Trametes elegans]|nr:hypothetical protein BD413DRAFT_250843 [Trametes elegans]